MRTFYKSVRQCLGDTASPRLRDASGDKCVASQGRQADEDMAAPTDVTAMSSLVQATRLGVLAQLCHAAAHVGARSTPVCDGL